MIPSVLPTYNRTPLSFVKGEGSWLWAEDGRRYLDLGSGIAVNALGHAHPALVQVLTEQGRQSAWVIATNVYLKTALGWRIVAHHASPGTPREAQEILESAAVLH